MKRAWAFWWARHLDQTADFLVTSLDLPLSVREVSPGLLFVVYANSNAMQTSQYREAIFDTVGRTVVVRRTGK